VVGADVVVVSSAVNADNVEVVMAERQGVPVGARAEMLGELMRRRQGIAVAGTHGKTTTASLLASIFQAAGLAPTYVIGAPSPGNGGPGGLGTGTLLSAEADESDASFLHLAPIVCVVTNIDRDHLDAYDQDFDRLLGTFVEFVQRLPFYGVAVVCGDDRFAAGILARIGRPSRTYGLGEGVDYRAVDIAGGDGAWTFTALRPEGGPLRVSLPLPGRHNVQNALAALAVGTLMGVLFLGDAPVIGEVPSGLPELQQPVLSLGVLAGAVQPAITLALLGAVDSLLTSLIADSMTRTRHSPNQELIGQGLGNIAAGLVGGLPGAGATVGTVVNIRAGGSTRVSGALRALVLLAIVLGAGSYVESVPLAALAGILLKVGWDIVDWRFLKRMHRVQREHLMIMGITMVLTVMLDLITAVAIGLIVAAMSAARQFERLQLDSVVSVPLLDRVFLGEDAEAGDADEVAAGGFSARVGLVSLRGTFTVASSKSLIDILGADIAEHEIVIIDFTDTVYIDDSAAMLVEYLIDTAVESNTEVIVMGLGGPPATSLRALNALDKVPRNRFVPTLDKARTAARILLKLPEPE